MSAAGTTYPPTSMALEPEHVRAFARAVGADPDEGVPPTYAAVYALFPTFGQLLADAGAAVDMRMLVHSEQEFEWSRHPDAGETLWTAGEVTEDLERRGMRFLTMVAVCRDAQQREVCRSRMVCIVRTAGDRS